MASPILVTSAAGPVGAIGRTVTELLLKQGKAVRVMVRNEDERARTLRDMGAQVVVGDLLDLESMHRVIADCETMYFGMSVSEAYLAATVNVAAVAKHHGVKAFINISQMTLSQMSITETTASPQHKLQWLSEQALNWSGRPHVHERPTVFLEGFFLIFTSDSVRESHHRRESSMIGVFVTFRYTDSFNEQAVRKIAETARARFEGLRGLRSKAFTVNSGKREATNFYLWDSEDAAKAFFNL